MHFVYFPISLIGSSHTFTLTKRSSRPRYRAAAELETLVRQAKLDASGGVKVPVG